MSRFNDLYKTYHKLPRLRKYSLHKGPKHFLLFIFFIVYIKILKIKMLTGCSQEKQRKASKRGL